LPKKEQYFVGQRNNFYDFIEDKTIKISTMFFRPPGREPHLQRALMVLYNLKLSTEFKL